MRAGYLTVLLVATCAALGAWAYTQWLAVQAPPEVAAAAPGGAAEPLPLPPQAPPMPPLASYGEVVERPLFSPSRRPPPQRQATAAAVVTPRPTQYMLEGTALTPRQRVALLRDTRTNVLHRLAVGDQLDGWEVSVVSAGEVALSQGQQTLELVLDPPQ